MIAKNDLCAPICMFVYKSVFGRVCDKINVEIHMCGCGWVWKRVLEGMFLCVCVFVCVWERECVFVCVFPFWPFNYCENINLSLKIFFYYILLKNVSFSHCNDINYIYLHNNRVFKCNCFAYRRIIVLMRIIIPFLMLANCVHYFWS